MSKFRLATGPKADSESYCPSLAEIYRTAARLRAKRPRPAIITYAEPSTPRILEREIRVGDFVGRERYEE